MERHPRGGVQRRPGESRPRRDAYTENFSPRAPDPTSHGPCWLSRQRREGRSPRGVPPESRESRRQRHRRDRGRRCGGRGRLAARRRGHGAEQRQNRKPRIIGRFSITGVEVRLNPAVARSGRSVNRRGRAIVQRSARRARSYRAHSSPLGDEPICPTLTLPPRTVGRASPTWVSSAAAARGTMPTS